MAITLTPQAPGPAYTDGQPDGGGTVSITVASSAGITSISYVVVIFGVWSWRSSPVVVPTSGSVVITPRILATGDFVKVWNTADEGDYSDTDQVTLSAATTLGTAAGSAAAVASAALTIRRLLGSAVGLSAAATTAGLTTSKILGTASGLAVGAGSAVLLTRGFLPPGFGASTATAGASMASGVFLATAAGQAQGSADLTTRGFLSVTTAIGAALATSALTTSRALGSAVGMASASGSAGLLTNTSPLQRAQAFVAPLTLGVNVERSWAWNAPGGTPALAAYLKARGFTHVRVFYPWRTGVDMLGEGTSAPSQAQFARILDATSAYVAAGLKVMLCCTDVITAYDDLTVGTKRDAVYQHITNAATWIAARNFDPTMVAIGPVNEWGGDDDMTAHQQAFAATFRAALPGHILCLSDKYWNHYSRMIARGAPYTADKAVLWCHHSYEVQSASGWTSTAASIRAWANAHGGVVTVWAEAGMGFSSWEQIVGQEANPAAWVTNLRDMIPAMGAERPTLWALTYGAAWRLNATQDAIALRSSPNLSAEVLALAAAIAGTGAPGDPPPPVVVPGGIVLPGAPAGFEGLFGLAGGVTASPDAPVSLVQAATRAQEAIAGLVAYAGALNAALAAQDAAMRAAAEASAEQLLALQERLDLAGL